MQIQPKYLPGTIRTENGFSLVEILAVTTIGIVLMGMAVGAFQKFLKKGDMAQELAAGRTLGAAYTLYASENGGRLLPGYDKTAGPIDLPDGGHIAGAAAARYVWRLAPYFDFNTDGIMYGKARKHAEETTEQSGEVGYGESLPPYGINAFFVGGYYDDGAWALAPTGSSMPGDETACYMGQVEKPASLLVFATAKNNDSIGNHHITAPRSIARSAGTTVAELDWPNNSTAASSGNVDCRYDNRALCVFLDGSVRSLTIEELKDMRLWSKNAAVANNPNYAPTKQTTGSGGRGGNTR